MRSRMVILTLGFYLTLVLLGCSSKPPADQTSTPDTSNPATAAAPAKAVKKEKRALIIPAGTELTVHLAQAVGSKISQAGQTFSASIAKPVEVEGETAIPAGAAASGTVTDAKPLGRFAGGAVLALRLDSVNISGSDRPVQVAVQTFSAKGKGKRTAVLAGGGAGLGALVGGLAGGGKGAAIGALAGGGAGTAGAAFTGNKDIVLPAESAVSFQLQQPLEIK